MVCSPMAATNPAPSCPPTSGSWSEQGGRVSSEGSRRTRGAPSPCCRGASLPRSRQERTRSASCVRDKRRREDARARREGRCGRLSPSGRGRWAGQRELVARDGAKMGRTSRVLDSNEYFSRCKVLGLSDGLDEGKGDGFSERWTRERELKGTPRLEEELTQSVSMVRLRSK